jgi:hypothetical protein
MCSCVCRWFGFVYRREDGSELVDFGVACRWFWRGLDVLVHDSAHLLRSRVWFFSFSVR